MKERSEGRGGLLRWVVPGKGHGSEERRSGGQRALGRSCYGGGGRAPLCSSWASCRSASTSSGSSRCVGSCKVTDRVKPERKGGEAGLQVRRKGGEAGLQARRKGGEAGLQVGTRYKTGGAAVLCAARHAAGHHACIEALGSLVHVCDWSAVPRRRCRCWSSSSARTRASRAARAS
jgi:hypothetical protein